METGLLDIHDVWTHLHILTVLESFTPSPIPHTFFFFRRLFLFLDVLSLSLSSSFSSDAFEHIHTAQKYAVISNQRLLACNYLYRSLRTSATR